MIPHDKRRSEFLIRAVHQFCKELGADNLTLEPLDIGLQLGVLFRHPITERKHAVRLKTMDEVPGAIKELLERTA